MTKIAVFGCGFVGGTVADFLSAGGVEVIRVDPKLYPDTDPNQAILDSDGIVIAVPTPEGEDGNCDDSIVKEVLDLVDHRTKVLLKSSVTYNLLQDYDTNVVYNPEFLREKYALEDFMNQKLHIFGYHSHNDDDARWWASLFSKLHSHPIETVFTNRKTASMIKYIHNSWLATKVAFFHELYDKLPEGIDYKDLINTLAMFPNIGPSHMQAPNSEGKLGYSGACFPKDINALTNVLDHSILNTVKKVNKRLYDKE